MNFRNTNRGSETQNAIHCTMRDIRRVRNVIQNDEIDRLRLQGPQVHINDEVIICKSELWLRGIVWPRGLTLAIMINKICGVCTTHPIWTKTPSRSRASHMFRSQVPSLCFGVQLVLMSIYLLRIAKLIQWLGVCFDHNTTVSVSCVSITCITCITCKAL